MWGLAFIFHSAHTLPFQSLSFSCLWWIRSTGLDVLWSFLLAEYFSHYDHGCYYLRFSFSKVSFSEFRNKGMLFLWNKFRNFQSFPLFLERLIKISTNFEIYDMLNNEVIVIGLSLLKWFWLLIQHCTLLFCYTYMFDSSSKYFIMYFIMFKKIWHVVYIWPEINLPFSKPA